MAERVGFEPTNELPRCWFSRPVLSTAQPPLLELNSLPFITMKVVKQQYSYRLLQILVNILHL